MRIKALTVVATLALSMLVSTPAQAVGETLDQVSLVPSYANAGLTTQTRRYQTFTAGLSGPLARLDLALSKRTLETSEPITVKLLSTNNAGEPNVTEMLAQTSIPARRVGLNMSWVRVIFANPFSLVSGNVYALELSTSQERTENILGQQAGFAWHGRDWNEPDYAGGASSTYVISSDHWYRNEYDMGFKTYSGAYTQPTTTVTYNLDGGTSTLPTEENQAAGDTFPVAENPTKPGFFFNGWTDQNETLFGGFEYINGIYTMGEANVVLKANWLSVSHPITRLVHNNDAGGTDTHWFWNGSGLHEGTDVRPGWCVISGPGSNPATWTVIGRDSQTQSESFIVNAPNIFQAAPYTFSPDPNIIISTGAEQAVLPNQSIATTAITNTGCAANKYAIEPALPRGLSLNENTGAISGAPTNKQARTVYTITARRYLNEDDLSLDVNGSLQGIDTATFTLTVGQTNKVKPILSFYLSPNVMSLQPFDLLRLKTALGSYSRAAKVNVVAYVYGRSSTARKYSKDLAVALISEIKKLRPALRPQATLKACSLAPNAASGSTWTYGSYRIDISR
jgi:uncharacterized repeat protein (TIGR02543 family)